MVNIQNRGYDPKVFTVSTKRSEVALLPNVGKFCGCGCGKRIEKTKRVRIINGRKIVDFLIPKNQIYATRYCKNKMHNKKHNSKYSLAARIQLRPENNIRIMTIYVDKERGRKVAITKAEKPIWNMMNQLEKVVLS